MSDEKEKSLAELMSTELALIINEDGTVDLKVRAVDDLAKPKEKKPWHVGVTENGEDVFAPIAGPNVAKVLHLKRDVAVCKVCLCTVHKRNAVVDPEGNVYCRPHWPFGSLTDPRENARLPEANSLQFLPVKRVEDDE